MGKPLKNWIVAVEPKFGISVSEVRASLTQALNDFEISYLHIGAGRDAAYAVLPDDQQAAAMGEIAASCNALVSGSGYLKPQNFEPVGFDGDWVERNLVDHPIDYDIPIVNGHDQIFGVCGRCGGIGVHIGPPCRA